MPTDLVVNKIDNELMVVDEFNKKKVCLCRFHNTKDLWIGIEYPDGKWYYMSIDNEILPQVIEHLK